MANKKRILSKLESILSDNSIDSEEKDLEKSSSQEGEEIRDKKQKKSQLEDTCRQIEKDLFDELENDFKGEEIGEGEGEKGEEDSSNELEELIDEASSEAKGHNLPDFTDISDARSSMDTQDLGEEDLEVANGPFNSQEILDVSEDSDEDLLDEITGEVESKTEDSDEDLLDEITGEDESKTEDSDEDFSEEEFSQITTPESIPFAYDEDHEKREREEKGNRRRPATTQHAGPRKKSKKQRRKRKKIKEAIMAQMEIEEEDAEIMAEAAAEPEKAKPPEEWKEQIEELRRENRTLRQERKSLEREQERLREEMNSLREEVGQWKQKSRDISGDTNFQEEVESLIQEMVEQKKSLRKMQDSLLEMQREKLALEEEKEDLKGQIQHLLEVSQDLKELPSIERFLEYIEATRQQLKRDTNRYQEKFEDRFKRIHDKYFHLEKVISYVRELKDLLKEEIVETQKDIEEETSKREAFEAKLAKFEDRIQIADNQKIFFKERCTELEKQVEKLKAQKNSLEKKADFQEEEILHNLSNLKENTLFLNRIIQKLIQAGKIEL